MATQSKSGKGAKGLFEDFETGSEGPILVGQKIEFPTMAVSCTAGSVSIRPGAEELFDPYLTNKYIALSAKGTVKISLKSPVMSFSFGVSTSASTPLNVKTYDQTDTLLFSKDVDVPDKGEAWRATFSRSAREISSIILFTGAGISYIDNFYLD